MTERKKNRTIYVVTENKDDPYHWMTYCLTADAAEKSRKEAEGIWCKPHYVVPIDYSVYRCRRNEAVKNH